MYQEVVHKHYEPRLFLALKMLNEDGRLAEFDTRLKAGEVPYMPPWGPEGQRLGANHPDSLAGNDDADFGGDATT